MMNHRVHLFKIIPLLLILAACFTASVYAQQSDRAPLAMVIRINGSLEWREDASGDWLAAKTKQPLYNSNQVRTALGNRAIIVYTSSGTRVLVNENTELEIVAQVPAGKFKKPTGERTKLLVGQVYSKIKEKGNDPGYAYEVETPTSVASVRGTEFDSQYGDGEATFLSLVNVVEVMNQLGTVLLNQYQQTTVAQGEAPATPETLSKNDAEKQTDWTDDVEPTWKLNLIPQGGANQSIEEAFTLTVWAENIESGSIDANASFTLTSISTTTDIMEFSTDNGKTWGGIPEITLANGQAVLMARGVTEGSVTITAEGADCEPASVGLTVTTPKAKKALQLKFTDPDGSNEETLIFDMEEK